jgi:hypothetical protein
MCEIWSFITITVFRNVALSSLVGIYRHFGKICGLLQSPERSIITENSNACWTCVWFKWFKHIGNEVTNSMKFKNENIEMQEDSLDKLFHLHCGAESFLRSWKSLSWARISLVVWNLNILYLVHKRLPLASLTRHVCPFFRTSARKNSAPNGQNFTKFDIWIFFSKICRENSSFIKIWQE